MKNPKSLLFYFYLTLLCQGTTSRWLPLYNTTQAYFGPHQPLLFRTARPQVLHWPLPHAHCGRIHHQFYDAKRPHQSHSKFLLEHLISLKSQLCSIFSTQLHWSPPALSPLGIVFLCFILFIWFTAAVSKDCFGSVTRFSAMVFFCRHLI